MPTLEKPSQTGLSVVRLSHLRRLIAQSVGLPGSPESSVFLQQRAETFVKRSGLKRFDELLDTENVEALRNLVAVDCSWFWRDSAQLTYLVEQLKPRLKGDFPQGCLPDPTNDRCDRDNVVNPIRVWSAATATGDEAYSIAIALSEALRQTSNNCASHGDCAEADKGAWYGEIAKNQISILGTDINAHSVAVARVGCYSERSLMELPEKLKTNYLQLTNQGQDTYRVSPQLKAMVHFEVDDLLALRPKSERGTPKFEAIFCRNVLIYFDEPYRYAALESLAAQLQPEGLLFLGSTESVGTAQQLFVRQAPGVYRLKANVCQRGAL